MKIKIKKRENFLLYLFLIMPYFELFTISMLEGHGFIIFGFIGKIFSVFRIINDFYILYYIVYKINIKTDAAKYLILYCLSTYIINLLHGGININTTIALANNVCFILMFDYFINKNQEMCLDVLIFLFGILSILGALNIILMPNGFFNAPIKDEAVYFLGSKNGSGEYFLIYLFLILLKRYFDGTKIKVADLVLAVVFIYCCVVCNSANSIFCLDVLFVYMLVQTVWKKIYRFIDLRVILFLCICIILIVIFNREVFSGIKVIVVEWLKKDMEFSGRVILWKQAIEYFMKNPLIGGGGEVIYWINQIKYEPHAHNMYLDVLAKSGIVPFLIMVIMIVKIINNITKKDEGYLVGIKGVFLAILLIHICFEDMSIVFLASCFIVIESVGKERSGSKVRKQIRKKDNRNGVI